MLKKTVKSWIARQAQRGRISFTMEELSAAFPATSPSMKKHGLFVTCKSGLTIHAWQGFYLLVPQEYRETGNMPPAEYIGDLMAYLHKPYCVALYDAATMYGVACPESSQGFTVMTSTPRPRCTISGGVPVEFIAKREMRGRIAPSLTRTLPTQRGTVVVSSPEYTVCTLVQHAVSLGGLAAVVPVIRDLLPQCNFAKLPAALKRYVTLASLQRLGYILERVIGDTERAQQLHRFLNPARSPFVLAKLVPQLPMAKCATDGKWLVIVNEDLTPVNPPVEAQIN